MARAAACARGRAFSIWPGPSAWLLGGKTFSPPIQTRCKICQTRWQDRIGNYVGTRVFVFPNSQPCFFIRVYRPTIFLICILSSMLESDDKEWNHSIGLSDTFGGWLGIDKENIGEASVLWKGMLRENIQNKRQTMQLSTHLFLLIREAIGHT